MSSRIKYNIPDPELIHKFRGKIVKWSRKNRRDYPWRQTRDPYRILIAEMMLQRTKADQVCKVYNKFFRTFDSPADVCGCPLAKLSHILRPLGLAWRVRNFKEVSCEIMHRFEGQVPNKRHNLKSLPGVGDYIAGMVLSVAFNSPEWAVDSNVVRFFRRFFAMHTTKEGRRDGHVIETARIYSTARNPKEANLGLIDFTALVCVPGLPRCESCILKKDCSYVLGKGAIAV